MRGPRRRLRRSMISPLIPAGRASRSASVGGFLAGAFTARILARCGLRHRPTRGCICTYRRSRGDRRACARSWRRRERGDTRSRGEPASPFERPVDSEHRSSFLPALLSLPVLSARSIGRDAGDATRGRLERRAPKASSPSASEHPGALREVARGYAMRLAWESVKVSKG